MMKNIKYVMTSIAGLLFMVGSVWLSYYVAYMVPIEYEWYYQPVQIITIMIIIMGWISGGLIVLSGLGKMLWGRKDNE